MEAPATWQRSTLSLQTFSWRRTQWEYSRWCFTETWGRLSCSCSDSCGVFLFFFLNIAAPLCPGPAEGGGPASAEAVCHSSCPAAVHQLPEPELVTLPDLETDEATHAGGVDSTVLLANYLQKCLLARTCIVNLNRIRPDKLAVECK